MKKKGFTLIELIVVMAIMVILMPIGIKSYKATREVINKLEKKQAVLDICDMLSFSKYYCKVHNAQGGILVSGREMFFIDYNNRNFQRKLVLPNNLQFTRSINLNCTYKGELNSGSITFEDVDGKNYRISISVGIDNINIYEE